VWAAAIKGGNIFGSHAEPKEMP